MQPTKSPPLRARLGATLLAGGMTAGLTSLAAVVGWSWVMPIEYFQDLAFQASVQDPYRQFEAIGRSEAACWLVRLLGPIGVLAILLVLQKRVLVGHFLHQVVAEAIEATTSGESAIVPKRVASIILRAALCSWFLFAGWQWAGAIDHRLTDWPYYRFRSGSEVLPNISDANRHVIRYVRASTPPESRIFVVSDQKLFFLSYYLLPRRIYHKTHPESEFVIPLAHQERKLAAYRLEDLDASWISEGRFDYVLEYFEYPDAAFKDRVLDDAEWIRFFREATANTQLAPPYYVRLSPLPKRAKS
jgi:hypothetical protein